MDAALIAEIAGQLDRTRRLLREHPERLADQTIDSLAQRGDFSVDEVRIAARLIPGAPLADVASFPGAHREMVRALEVLRDEGAGAVNVRLPQPLSTALEMLTRTVASFVLDSYQQEMVGRLGSLYAMREAQCEPGTAERRALARARLDIERLRPYFSGGGLGALYVLAGGALLPALAWLADRVSVISISWELFAAALPIAVVLFAMLSFVMLRGAVSARRQVRLVVLPAAGRLWQVIGDCGDPPADNGGTVAAIAIVLTALAWFGLPVIIVVGVNAFT